MQYNLIKRGEPHAKRHKTMKTLELMQNVIFGKVMGFERIITFHLYHTHVIYRVNYLSSMCEGNSIVHMTCYVEIKNKRTATKIENADFMKRIMYLSSMC